MIGQMSIFDFIDCDEGNSKEFDPVEMYLLHGTGFVDGKKRVRSYFIHNKGEKERIEFLKHEYGLGGFACWKDKPCMVTSGEWNAQKHIIKYNDTDKTSKTITVTYKKLVDVIDKMIKNKKYI